MLPLDDTRWGELEGSYRVPYDASVVLRRMEAGEDVWQELSDIPGVTDSLTLQSALAVLALAHHEHRLGAILNDIDADEIRDNVEERLNWSALYSY